MKNPQIPTPLTRPQAVQPPDQIQQQIRQRAYELYETTRKRRRPRFARLAYRRIGADSDQNSSSIVPGKRTAHSLLSSTLQRAEWAFLILSDLFVLTARRDNERKIATTPAIPTGGEITCGC